MENIEEKKPRFYDIEKTFNEIVDKEINGWVKKATEALKKSKDKVYEKEAILTSDSFTEANGTFDVCYYPIDNPDFFKTKGYIKELEKEHKDLKCYRSEDPAIRGGSLYPRVSIVKIKEADKDLHAFMCLDEDGECKYCNYEKCISGTNDEREKEHKGALVKRIADKYGLDCENATYESLPFLGKLKYTFSKKNCPYYSEIKDDTAYYGALQIDGITKTFLTKLIDEAKKLNITFNSIKVRIGESTKDSTKARTFHTFILKDGQLTDESIPIFATSNTRMFSMRGKNTFAAYDPFMEIGYTLKVERDNKGE